MLQDHLANLADFPQQNKLIGMRRAKKGTSKHSRRELARDKAHERSVSLHLLEEDEEGDDDDAEEELTSGTSHTLQVPVKLWEFGQNDPKKDSGSRLTRLGVAESLRIGCGFNGIVLSSETTNYISAADKDILSTYGVAGINCSWNRLQEIPFGSLGRDRNQRVLPYLLAANSINYGRPFKLNTAEAIAAALYIAGFKEDALHVMSSFNYGAEFFRINEEALLLYTGCATGAEVAAAHVSFMSHLEDKKKDKERRKEQERAGCGLSTSYSGMPDFDEEDQGDELGDFDDEETLK